MGFDNWDDILCHHGIKGMKWGIRRYQNADGTLTEEGRAKYGKRGFYREVKNASKQSRRTGGSTYTSDILKNHPNVLAARERLRADKQAADRAQQDYIDYKNKNYRRDAIRYIKKKGRVPDSELDLLSVDKGLTKLSNKAEKVTNRYVKKGTAEAAKLLGIYGNRRLYAKTNSLAGNQAEYEKAKHIVYNAITAG